MRHPIEFLRSICSRPVMAALLAAGSLGGATLGTVMATESPAFADSHGCGDNVCVTFTGQATTDVSVQTWAAADTFNGYFTLTGPDSVNQSSDTETWQGGQDSDSYTFQVPAAPAGTYCVTATGSDGSSLGTACEHVEDSP